MLFGYDPLFLGAWERDRAFAGTVCRARTRGSRSDAAKAAAPLGRGVWVLDASDTNNVNPRLQIEMRTPSPAAEFEARAFGPFLVIRTDGPTLTPRRYLELAGRAMLLGRSLADRRRGHQPPDIEPGGAHGARLRRGAFPLDDLAVAGSVLESGEPAGSRRGGAGAAAAGARPQSPRRPREAAEEKRAQACRAPLSHPWQILPC